MRRTILMVLALFFALTGLSIGLLAPHEAGAEDPTIRALGPGIGVSWEERLRLEPPPRAFERLRQRPAPATLRTSRPEAEGLRYRIYTVDGVTPLLVSPIAGGEWDVDLLKFGGQEIRWTVSVAASDPSQDQESAPRYVRVAHVAGLAPGAFIAPDEPVPAGPTTFSAIGIGNQFRYSLVIGEGSSPREEIISDWVSGSWTLDLSPHVGRSVGWTVATRTDDGPPTPSSDALYFRVGAENGAVTGKAVYEGTQDPVAGVLIDVFSDNRESYLTTVTTGDDGRFTAEVDLNGGSRCRIFTYIAPPDMVFSNTSRYIEKRACVTPGETVTLSTVNVRRNSEEPATVAVLINGDSSFEGTVTVDLFTASADGSRSTYVESKPVGHSEVEFQVSSGCYVIVFIAPDQTPPAKATFDTGMKWDQRARCVTNGETVTEVARVQVSRAGSNSISGAVLDSVGGPVEGITADLFGQKDGRFIIDAGTGSDGAYRFDVDEGCYRLTFIAPDGDSFVGGTGRWRNVDNICVADGQHVTVDATLNP